MQQNKSTCSSATAPLKLSTLKTKQFTKANKVGLSMDSASLALIDGQLWCGAYKSIQVYNISLLVVRSVKMNDIDRIGGLAEADANAVAVAAINGLFVIDKQGKVKRCLNDGRHDEVSVCAGLLYATPYKQDGEQFIHVYSTENWQQISKFSFNCIASTHLHCVCINERQIVVSCSLANRIFRMSPDGKMIDTFDNSGNGIGKFQSPCACMTDTEGSLLVADWRNHRLQLLHVEQWSVLQLEPPPSLPRSAVYDGNALYVLHGNPYGGYEAKNELVKYESID